MIKDAYDRAVQVSTCRAGSSLYGVLYGAPPSPSLPLTIVYWSLHTYCELINPFY